MNKQLCLIILLLTCRICSAQSLIPNGDFEQYSSCPNSQAQLYKCLNWMTPTTNVLGVSGTPEYYNQCSNAVGVPYHFPNGFQLAHSGGAYAAIYLWTIGSTNREYIEDSLTSPLIANACYHFEMYVNLHNLYSRFTTDDIGIYFSDTMVTGINNLLPLPFTAQINNDSINAFDTLSWTLVSGDYIAHGGETNLIIGNFKNDSSTTTTLYNTSSNYSWIYVYIDDVSLTPCSTGINEHYENAIVNIYPNPVLDMLNVEIGNNDESEIILYDIASRKLLQQKFTNSVSINTEELVKGIYLYEVRCGSSLCKKGKLVKD